MIGETISNFNSIYFYQSYWKKYLRLFINERIGYDFSAYLHQNNEKIKIKIIHRSTELYKKYLINEDTVLIHNI